MNNMISYSADLHIRPYVMFKQLKSLSAVIVEVLPTLNYELTTKMEALID